MSWLYLALLAAAVALVAGAEWPRLRDRFEGERFGGESRRRRERARRKAKSHLRVVSEDDEADEFAASVERDLANLPTIDDR